MKNGVPRSVACSVVINKWAHHEILNLTCSKGKVFMCLSLFNTTLTRRYISLTKRRATKELENTYGRMR
jgi:hypothetical protein